MAPQPYTPDDHNPRTRHAVPDIDGQPHDWTRTDSAIHRDTVVTSHTHNGRQVALVTPNTPRLTRNIKTRIGREFAALLHSIDPDQYGAILEATVNGTPTRTAETFCYDLGDRYTHREGTVIINAVRMDDGPWEVNYDTARSSNSAPLHQFAFASTSSTESN